MGNGSGKRKPSFLIYSKKQWFIKESKTMNKEWERLYEEAIFIRGYVSIQTAV